MMGFITLYWKKLPSLLLCFFSFALLAFPTQAKPIKVDRAEAELFSDGQLQVSTRFTVELPPSLSEALLQGVALNFKLEFTLDKPRLIAYRIDQGNWFGPLSEMTFKLTYHPFTQRYRVAIGSFTNNYDSLSAALRAIGGIAGWQVLPPGKLAANTTPGSISAKVRLSLDLSHLPKPFQLNALGSTDWQLSSDWIPLSVKANT